MNGSELEQQIFKTYSEHFISDQLEKVNAGSSVVFSLPGNTCSIFTILMEPSLFLYKVVK